MAKFSDENIVDSNATFLCFSASTVLRPSDIHGDKEVAPMGSMSALAKALYNSDNRLATTLAGQYQKAKLIQQQHMLMPFIKILMSDNQYVSPFIVRRHTRDKLDNSLVVQSTQAMIRHILAEVYSNRTSTYAIERPFDADVLYDKIIHTLPDNVTVYKEQR